MVLAIHGFWSGDRLCLWAEDSDLSVKSPSQALRSARPHPFATATPDLAEVITSESEARAVPRHEAGSPTASRTGTATLLLPSVRQAPIDSPELVRLTARREPAKGPALLPWSVPVITLEPSAALGIGSTLGGGSTVGGGSVRDGAGMPGGYDEAPDVRLGTPVRFGVSVRFVAELAAFARDLVERGRVLPVLLEGEADESGVAAWRPVLQGPDLLAAQDLVAAVPPVFRAEARTPEDDRGQSPADLVSAALHALVDAAMRERQRSMSLLPKR
ncbi:MAG: hypothetical protein WBG76_03495, partial [Ornithinimicrobium sp.]